MREAQRRWREANPEKEKQRKRRLYKANPKQARERANRWRKANPEESAKYIHSWREANPEAVRAIHQRRRALKRNQHGLLPVTAEVISQRFGLFGHACVYCGAQHDLQADHFIPLNQGGTHAPSNLVPACPNCNKSKRDRDPEQWYRQQPSFNEQRWRQIQKATGHHKAPGQLALV